MELGIFRCSPSAREARQGELSAKGVQARGVGRPAWNPLRLGACAPSHLPLPRFALGEDLVRAEEVHS